MAEIYTDREDMLTYNFYSDKFILQKGDFAGHRPMYC